MPKILVADDNSNVQKTVSLALAGLGVEVVSVNNGEAAVRKLSDVAPDLVLADIFMPVRSGYEVCEYIKKDSRFARVPVVLLVGAFDPLDEREAQRVGADGILKKPFVPPDPLITMVKTLLDRTLGDRLVAVSAASPKTAVATESKPDIGAASGIHTAVEVHEEPSSQEFPPPVERVAFGESDHPIAFGGLLEAAVEDSAAKPEAIEPVDDEQILTSSRDANLGDPIFWRNDSHEPEAQPEESAEAPAEDASEDLEIRAWERNESSLPRREDAILLQSEEPLALVHDEQEESSQTVTDPASIVLDPAAQASLTVDADKAEDLAATPLEWMATASAEHPDEAHEAVPAWKESIPEAAEPLDKMNAIESSDHQQGLASDLALDLPPVSEPVSELTLDSIPASEHSTGEETPAAATPEAVATPVKASLPEGWLAAVTGKPLEIPTSPVAAAEPPATTSPKPEASPAHLSQSATETVRSFPKQEWADLSAGLHSDTREFVTVPVKPAAGPPAPSAVPVGTTGKSEAANSNGTKEGSPDPVLVEAVVQRVLDKMRPQVVDIITKEFLRPIVQALVHREIEKH